jgi:hypothetical protein
MAAKTETALDSNLNRDRLGYNFEMSNLSALKQYKLSKYIEFCNPKDFPQWKRKIAHGVDLVLKVFNIVLYIEESFCSKVYTYRINWFKKCRLPRFEGYPQNKNHIHIILTNRLSNFSHVKNLAQFFNTIILDFNQLLQYIRELVNTYNVTNEINKCVPVVMNKIEEAITGMDFTSIEKELMKNG